MKALIIGILLGITFTSYSGEIFSFERISDDYVNDLGLTISMEVSEAGSDQVDLIFRLETNPQATQENQDAISAVRVHSIYIDDRQCDLISGGSVQSSTGNVEFTSSATKNGRFNLPGGNNVDFEASKVDSWYTQRTNANYTLDLNETLTLRYNINDEWTYSDIIAALYDKETDKLRAGLHIGGFEEGSASYVSVPEPSTYALMAMSVFFLIYLSKARKEEAVLIVK